MRNPLKRPKVPLDRNGNTINGLAANATQADGVGAIYIFETTEGWQSAWGS